MPKARLDWQAEAAKGPIVALAPMDGYTDSAYRQIAKIVEPRCFVFCEFVSADGLSRARRKMSRLVQFNPRIERPYIVQIFGKNPQAFAEAAEFLEAFGVDGIDINYGCPAKKVVGSGHGSSMIRTPCLAAECVAAVKNAVTIPVTTKTRLGWEDPSTLINFVGTLIEAGSEMITIHGRTVKQQYMGAADWDPIYELKKAYPDTPILGNGDITSGQIARDKLGNLDGVMIGRGTFGNPWLLKEAYAALHGEDYAPLTPQEKGDIIRQHAQILIATKGESRAMKEFRKHLLNFTKGFPGSRELRGQMTSIENMDDVEKVVEVIMKGS